MNQVEARPAIKDFAALGAAFGIRPEPRPLPSDPIREFRSLPIGRKFERIQQGVQAKDPLTKVYKAMATYDVLHMDPRDRQAEGIQVVTVAPLTPDGQIEYQPFRAYGSFVINSSTSRPFGFFQDKSVIDSKHSRIMKGNESGEEFSHDRLRHTEWIPESFYDRYFQVSLSVKHVDRAIRVAKGSQVDLVKDAISDIKTQRRRSTAELTYLNRVKYQFLIEYLSAVEDMQEQYPYLGRLAILDSAGSDDSLHMRLYMTIPLDWNYRQRAVNPHLEPIPKADHTIMFDTSINTSFAKKQKEDTERGSEDPADHLGWKLCTLLGI